MAKGLLVKILLHTRTTHYLDFAKVGGSYVMAKGYVNKVPATAAEAMASNLMGMFEKRRMKKLLDYAFNYNPDDAATHGGKDMSTQPMQATFDDYSLDAATATFIGHSIALFTDDKCADASLPPLTYTASTAQLDDTAVRAAGDVHFLPSDAFVRIVACVAATSPSPRLPLWRR